MPVVPALGSGGGGGEEGEKFKLVLESLESFRESEASLSYIRP